MNEHRDDRPLAWRFDMVRMCLANGIDFSEEDVRRADIGSWIFQSGPTAESNASSAGRSRGSFGCFRGMSWRNWKTCFSRAVLTVFKKFRMERRARAGTCSVLAAMGPEFCPELVLLRW